MKRELKELKSKYPAIFESGNATSIVVVNGEGTIIDCNLYAETTFGYAKSEVVGFPLAEFFVSSREEVWSDKSFSAITKLIHYSAYKRNELFGLKKGGTRFPLELEILKGETTSGVYYIAVMVDSSIQTALEVELKKKSRELELLLYRSAHDLKAPFCSAEGLMNLLKDEDVSPNVREILNMLETTLEKGRNLLDDLALVSIISQNNRSVEKINFVEITKEALQTLKSLDGFEHVAFELQIKLQNNFYSNTELLSALFKNLIQFAINYAHSPQHKESSGVRLMIKNHLDDVKIAIAFNTSENDSDCSDKGIFDLSQFTNDYSLSYTGLEEYVVKNIVGILDGKIRVKTLDELGTCVEITLPNGKTN